MGSSSSRVLVPLSLPDCAAEAGSVTDARIVYACTSSSTLRLPYAFLHLIILTCVVFGTALVYAIYARVCARRQALRLRAITVAANAATTAGPLDPFRTGAAPPAAIARRAADACLNATAPAHPALLAAAMAHTSAPAVCSAILAAAREAAFALRAAASVTNAAGVREGSDANSRGDAGAALLLRAAPPDLATLLRRAADEDPECCATDLARAQELLRGLLKEHCGGGGAPVP